MAVKLLFFAQCAQWLGRKDFSISAPKPVSLRKLIAGVPELAALTANQGALRVAVNSEYADFNAEVSDGDEVAFLPPFSGG